MKLCKLFRFGLLSSSIEIYRGGLLFLLVMFVAGCSHDFALRKPDGTIIGQGTINYGISNSNAMLTLKINGIAYSGLWESHKIDESGYIAAQYGVGSRKFREYSLGNGNYLKEGHATLHSDQGGVLTCEITYRGTSGHGFCESGSDKFDVVVTESYQAVKNTTN